MIASGNSSGWTPAPCSNAKKCERDSIGKIKIAELCIDLRDLLLQFKLADLSNLLQKEHVLDVDTLLLLNEMDLEKIKMKLGDRKKLMRCIQSRLQAKQQQLYEAQMHAAVVTSPDPNVVPAVFSPNSFAYGCSPYGRKHHSELVATPRRSDDTFCALVEANRPRTPVFHLTHNLAEAQTTRTEEAKSPSEQQNTTSSTTHAPTGGNGYMHIDPTNRNAVMTNETLAPIQTQQVIEHVQLIPPYGVDPAYSYTHEDHPSHPGSSPYFGKPYEAARDFEHHTHPSHASHPVTALQL